MRIKLSDKKTTKCTALINGQLVNYDACETSINDVYETWNYLGQGTSSRLMG